MEAPYKSARHLAVELSHYQHSLLFGFMNAALSSRKHGRLSNAVIENAWLVELHMAAADVTMAGDYA